MDNYRTLSKDSPEFLFKERKSKFFGYAFPVANEFEIKRQIEALHKLHPNANHICYAWQLGIDSIMYRANDDGEPNNSAGKPIHGQIQSFKITNVLVAVVRYFGGTKLGVGGLIQAYKETAKLTLDNSTIIEKELMVILVLRFGYENINNVMSAIKKFDCKIVNQEMDVDCKMKIELRSKSKPNFLKTLKKHQKISIMPV